MSVNNGLYTSATDEWSTPPPIFPGPRCRIPLHAGSMRDGCKPQGAEILHGKRRRARTELGRGNGFHKPTIRPGNRKVDPESGGGIRDHRHNMRHVATSKNRHGLVS
jgi:hypothetical protein